MIDLLGAYLPQNRPLTDAKGELIEKVCGPNEGSKPLEVRYRNGLMSVRGSLPKFWKGSNVTPLSAEELTQAIKYLALVLGSDFLRAKVGQLEIGTTIAVEHRPRLYTLSWKTFGKYHWSCLMDGDTVQIGNRSRAFIGYDKGKECGCPLPVSEFPKGWGLRLEMKLRKASTIRRVVGHPLEVRQLLEPTVQELLKERWRDFYFAIPKSPKPFSGLSGLNVPKAKQAWAWAGIESLGWSYVRGMIGEAEEQGTLEKTQACRLRAAMRTFLDAANLWDKSNLVEEVNQAVLAA